MTLSIIIPVYKAEQYLEECVNSIICQVDFDYEIILIDDGSPDNSGIICDNLAKMHNTIRVVHQKNAGVSAARNKGISVARGEYLSFVDSDDFVTSNYLHSLSEGIKTGADLLIFNYIRWVSRKEQEQGHFGLQDGTFWNIKRLYENALKLEISSLSVCSSVYKRNIIVEHDLCFDTFMSVCEDFTFNLRYYKYIKSYYAKNEPVYYYRENLDSASQKRPLKHALDYQKVYDCIGSVIRTHYVDEDSIRVFSRRWIRWLISLIANYKMQGIGNNKLTVVYKQDYYMDSLQIKAVSTLHAIEKFMLKHKMSTMIYWYMNFINRVKKLLNRNRL